MQAITRLTGAIAIAVLAGAAHAQYELVWSDEFDGATLDLSKWEPMIGDGCNYGVCNWGNNEWQYYTSRPENLLVGNGVLTITARRETYGGKQYTSARLRTLGLADFLYGRIEASLQIPDAGGVWPAFWMLPTNSPYGGWAASGEIDIMESTNDAERVYGTLHYGDNWPNNTSSGGSTTMGGIDFSAGYHVYAIEWSPDIIRWYVDDTLYSTKTSSQWYSASSAAAGNTRAPFDVPFHILLNVAVGGDWPGSPTAADYPVTMKVDYVRVYQIDPVDPEPQSPFFGSPSVIPGLIQAEDFDNGDAGDAYYETDVDNNGGQYRATGVDIEVCNEGGYNIGWVRQGEWTEYTVNVLQTGTYRVDTRVAAQSNGGTFRFEIDGTPVSGDVAAPVTGGWQTWVTATTEVDLEAGEHILRFANTSGATGEFNFNSFDFVLLTTPCLVDIDGNGTLNLDDVNLFATGFTSGDLGIDQDGNGVLNLDDVNLFAQGFVAGCP
ncbi:MAG: family 16 glycosylhydrolase [Phycisphaerales bacterium]